MICCPNCASGAIFQPTPGTYTCERCGTQWTPTTTAAPRRTTVTTRRVTTITIDFGPDETDLAQTVVAAPWTTLDGPITVNPAGTPTPDHDPIDTILEDIRAAATHRVEGVGFTITAYAPHGTWGRHTFHVLG